MRRLLPRFLALLLVGATQGAAQAPVALQQRIEAVLAAGPPGTRYGLVVDDADGHELVAIAPEARFIPASNTKIFTTATAFSALAGLDRPDMAGGAAVRLDEAAGRVPDVVIEGHGDARLSSAVDCVSDCLATLADAVAARTRVVRDVIGDDSLFPDERWSLGMSWNNIPTDSGTGISALTIDDNEVPLVATAGVPGKAASIELPAYYSVDNRVTTIAGGVTHIGYDRAPNGLGLLVTGTIAAGAGPYRDKIGIDDPARYAAWRLRTMLIARGVRVTGTFGSRHRHALPSDDPAQRHGAPPARPPREPVLAGLTPPPLGEDLVRINKVSQNLHAELLLRRIGLVKGTGSVADGLAAVRAMALAAGVPRANFDLSDGSGMSTYNRVSPRGMVTLLRWIAGQPWGPTWRATLPIGGEGSLTRRFAGTALDHKIFAKTGTLNATSALAGYLVAKSGRTLTFALYANDVPDGASATRTMDAALLAIADAS